MSGGGESETSVQVAVRIRPQNAREQIDMCRVCTFCTPGTPQIVLGKDKAFTYDFVFDTTTEQGHLYETCVENLVKGCFDGYNATVLAYGQTGSGKTYTMGTGFDVTVLPEELGVIPRAVQQIFAGIHERKQLAMERDVPLPQFEVKAQFLELYNEEIIDLFEEQNRGKLRIHEDSVGNIYVAGATEIKVHSEEETLACLKRGALSRTVGSTNMNAQSSRSHAIFTLLIIHQRCLKTHSNEPSEDSQPLDSQPLDSQPEQSESLDFETLKAKFHFVDLAGSERLKRTGATGERAKEGISINCGLLALGNVISALGDKAKKGSHVPYRDSKLTRFLQDSLGGNSKTLMIACISPTDRDFMETLNTLKYSNRARNIKNKVVINQDKMSQQLTILRSRIQELEVELQEFKSGRMVVNEDGSVAINDMANEITMLRTENDKLRMRVKALQQVIDSQSSRLATLSTEKEAAAFGLQDESTGQVLTSLGDSGDSGHSDHLTSVIQGYLAQIEELKSRLILSESLAHQNPCSPFRRAPSTLVHREQTNQDGYLPFSMETDDLLRVAKTNIERLKMKEKRGSSLSENVVGPHEKQVKKLDTTLQENDVKVADPDFIEEGSSNEDSCEEASDDTELHANSSEDSDTDADETESLASSIAELSSEINLKQQLVDQLEKAQKNLYTMKAQYEDKMKLLQHQIKSIESERDRVLKEINNHRSAEKRDEKSREAKAKYEAQLSELKAELKSLKSARKEHARAMKKNAQHERELKILKNELLDMKKQRVKMMNKMRSEANQKKIDDARMAKEISQLQKESRRRDNRIKSLESDAQRKELILKRRQEELCALRREKRNNRTYLISSNNQSTVVNSIVPMSATFSTVSVVGPGSDTGCNAAVPFRLKAVTRDSGTGIDRHAQRRMSSIFSSDSARKKWRELEKKVFDAVVKRQTMANLAKDMDAWIEKRDQLSRKLDKLKKQQQNALKLKSIPPDELATIDEDLDSISAHIDYIQENIVELQNDLIAVDDVKSDGDTLEAHSIINSSSPRESKYLLEHLLDLVLNLGVKAAQKEAETKLLEARLKASEESAEILKSFSSPQVLYPVVTDLDEDTPSGSCSESPHHSSLPVDSCVEVPFDVVDSAAHKKSRRRTILPSELPLNTVVDSKPSSSDKPDQERQCSDPPASSGEDYLEGDPARLRINSEGCTEQTSKKKGVKKRAITTSSLDLSSSNSASSCPSSPNLTARPLKSAGSEVNVWSRLATTSTAAVDNSKGSIQAEKIDFRKASAKMLHCTHTACGHSASVLSVFATQNYMFSASQDRTAKVWNLKTCTELLTLDKHFSYVRCVRFCPRNNLIITASQSLIKLWDMRHHRARCIKTFGPPAGYGPASGSESAVQDLLVSPTGDTLYSASGNFINIWDLKKFMHRGRLVGHNGAVCALAVKDKIMATGSRDRLIKLYDLEALDAVTLISQPSICTLYPPHYDAVSSLALHNDYLFSSCGVTIKQWDIKERCLKQAVDGAHSQGNNINSLATFTSPLMPMLVSVCKGGFLKMWNPETCSSIGEIVAHKNSINSVATSSTCIFTGSSDKTIRIWRPSPQDI